MTKILLIENEAFLRKLYSEFLSMSKYEVHSAENGRTGLDKIGMVLPDLIILDIRMPVMDGAEFLKYKTKDLKYRKIPVLLLTGIPNQEEINECLDLGALGYVEKSTHPVDLLNKIEKILSKPAQKEVSTITPNREELYDIENL
ncbi:MAG: response regulator [Thermodesulfobacteriota bacterium]